MSSSVVPFSSCLQSCLSQWVSSLPSDGQTIGASASASILPMEYSGLTSSRMDWLDLFAVQRTLKSLLQHQSSKASILRLSAFFMVQLSHPYMTAGKTIALTRWTIVGKVIFLLFIMLPRFVIAFLPRSKWKPSSIIVSTAPRVEGVWETLEALLAWCSVRMFDLALFHSCCDAWYEGKEEGFFSFCVMLASRRRDVVKGFCPPQPSSSLCFVSKSSLLLLFISLYLFVLQGYSLL